jgi:hypothetical protein
VRREERRRAEREQREPRASEERRGEKTLIKSESTLNRTFSHRVHRRCPTEDKIAE